MKGTRRLLALALGALMLLLSACNVFETKLAQAVEKMSRKDSVGFALTAELELSLSAGGGNEEAEAPSIMLSGRFEASGALYTDPLRLQTNAQLSLPGTQTRWECYLEKDEGAYYLYSRTNDGTLWQKQGLADDGKARIKGLKTIVRGTESFLPAGEEELSGRAAARYDGVLAGEYIAELLELYRVREWLCDELGLQLAEGLFEELPDVPASVWLDRESGMIVRAEAELGELVSSLGARQLALSREASGWDALGLEVHAERAHLTLVLSDFDETAPFRIPDEAKSAWGSDVMPWDS